MTPQASALLLALLAEAPTLVAQLIVIWHKQGKVTTDEIAAWLGSQWPDPASFFTAAGVSAQVPPVQP